MDCLFCKICDGSIDTNIIYDDPQIMAFHDISPQAPTHILIIPKKHIATINDTDDNDELLLGRMILTAKKLSRKYDIANDGYRLVFNTNDKGGQTVHHIHLHMLGGRQMHWPPG